MTSSAAKHPGIIAIRYQLNLMELTRKLKTRRQHRGQPCTNNTDNIWRESRMTSSRLHGQRTFRPNLMTSVELVSLVCSTLTMHYDCVQYQQRAADFNPWVCTFGSHNCIQLHDMWGQHLDKVLFKRPSVKSQLTLVHDSDTKQTADFAPVAASSQRAMKSACIFGTESFATTDLRHFLHWKDGHGIRSFSFLSMWDCWRVLLQNTQKL